MSYGSIAAGLNASRWQKWCKTGGKNATKGGNNAKESSGPGSNIGGVFCSLRYFNCNGKMVLKREIKDVLM